MADCQLALFSPGEMDTGKPGAIRQWNDYPVRFLAHGDSWFSFGAIPPWATSSILNEIELGFDASAINCAAPNGRLAHMVEWKRARDFCKLLAGKFAYRWDGILLSGGGNDLIAATGVLPMQGSGQPVSPESRLLLKPDEWEPASEGVARYLSSAGWKTFCDHLGPQFADVVNLRDQDVNKDVPLFCHSYDYPLPRNSPASALLRFGPWIYPSMLAYGIPPEDWLALVTELIDRLAALLRRTVADLNRNGDRHVYLIETQGTLTPAALGSTMASNDWENEIHPARRGYRKLAVRWRPVVEAKVKAL